MTADKRPTPPGKPEEPALTMPSETGATLPFRGTLAPSASGDQAPGLQPAGGNVLGDYELLELLGLGGMGVVYKARQRSVDRIVALKVIRIDRLDEFAPEHREEWLQRFHTEAQAAARIEHEHVVTVYEVGEVEGHPFYSMRYIDGHSLSEMVRDGPLPGRKAAEYLEPVARAVHHAHTCGILHRDLKPRNILVDQLDRPYVADFGLAKLSESASDMTHTGAWLGTPSYMSPEQAMDAAHVTVASDIYSLGATLYDLLTGRPPFQAATPTETLHQVLHQEPVPPRHLNESIDGDLETICLKCLQKESTRRYSTAATLADDLRRYLDGEAIHARPVGWLERAWRWCRRNPRLALATGSAALFLVATAVVSVLFAVNQSRSAREIKNQQGETAAANKGLKTNLYWRNIAAADREFAAGRVGAAEELLDECPEELRGWEWYFLKRKRYGTLTFRGHGQAIRGLAFSPDSRLIASGGLDETVKVWEARTGRVLHSLRHAGPVNWVLFSPDGRHVAAESTSEAHTSGFLKVWDAETGAKSTCAAFTPAAARWPLAARPGGWPS